jgi:iron uptake system EfeUOB component EfeO/EfeM
LLELKDMGPWVRSSLIAAAVLVAVVATGCGAGEEGVRPESAPATKRYRSYLEERATTLIVAVSQMASKIKVGYVGSAESRYVYARVPLGQLEPVVTALSADFGGFRRIERALWKEETTDGLLPIVRRLIDGAQHLRRRLQTVDLRMSTKLDGAATVLDEIVTSKIAGQDAPFSHMGMVDVSANVEGAAAAFKAFRSELGQKDPRLVDEIEAQFSAVFTELRKYGQPARDPDQTWPSQPGISFSPYEPSPAEARQTARPFERLASLFSQIRPSGGRLDLREQRRYPLDALAARP